MTTSRIGGATGAGVPRPVHPKSQTHRSATANPITDGIAASHRQRAVSTWNLSHPGNSQNHSAKNAVPTASDAAADSQGFPCAEAGELPDRPLTIDPPAAHVIRIYFVSLDFVTIRGDVLGKAASGGFDG
jgi:hypothetical protein